MKKEQPFVVVANRLPVYRVEGSDGTTAWRTSPGGLVSALRPILQDRPSRWVGWTGQRDDPAGPFESDGIRNCPVPITGEEVRYFYDGFCNPSRSR